MTRTTQALKRFVFLFHNELNVLTASLKDILAIIMQYLQDEGFHASHSVLYDETNVKWKEREEKTVEVKRLKKAILGTESSNMYK